MRRRDYLAAAAAVGTAGVAGCGGEVETRALRSTPPVLENRPEGVYHPTHVDGMEPVGTTETGDYAVALAYTYPHRFWRIDAATESVADAARESPDGTDVHLMALAWDPETGRTLPESGLSLEIARDGATVGEGVIYNMLSPQMGFHYGANFALDGDGTYDVRVTVGGTTVRRTGAYRGRFDDRLGYHYGAVVDTPSAGDELTVRVRTAPQVDRHEGYETAFLSMPDASLTLQF